MTSSELILKAESILKLKGIEFNYSGESTTNGLSVYFSANYKGYSLKIRFSNHSVTNIDRMRNEIHFDNLLLDCDFHINSRISQIGYMFGIDGYKYGKADCKMPNGKIVKGFTYFKL